MKASSLTTSGEIQEGAIRREDDGFRLWHSQGLIMVDYLEQCRTINGTYYADKLRRLRPEIACKSRGKLTQCVLLLHDNAPAHTSQVTMDAATDCGFEIFPHPRFSGLGPSLTSICFRN
jgi:hypothetical protein